MNDKEIFKRLEESLLMGDDDKLVRLELGPVPYFTKSFVKDCIKSAKTSIQLAAMGMDTLNPLERLGLHVLLDSAHIKKCDHVWGTDGQHSNEFCKKCFVDKSKS